MIESVIMTGKENLNTIENNNDSNVVLNGMEQKAVFFALTDYLWLHTKHEVRGLLTPELIEINDNLRSVVKKILSENKDIYCDRLSIGIVDDMSDFQLSIKATDDHYDNVNRTDEVAGYFLRKRQNNNGV